jgi:hypothetical protein
VRGLSFFSAELSGLVSKTLRTLREKLFKTSELYPPIPANNPVDPISPVKNSFFRTGR